MESSPKHKKNNRNTPLNPNKGPHKGLLLLAEEGGLDCNEFCSQVAKMTDVGGGRFVLNRLRRMGYVQVLVCLTPEGREALRVTEEYMDAQRKKPRRMKGG